MITGADMAAAIMEDRPDQDASLLDAPPSVSKRDDQLRGPLPDPIPEMVKAFHARSPAAARRSPDPPKGEWQASDLLVLLVYVNPDDFAPQAAEQIARVRAAVARAAEEARQGEPAEKLLRVERQLSEVKQAQTAATKRQGDLKAAIYEAFGAGDDVHRLEDKYHRLCVEQDLRNERIPVLERLATEGKYQLARSVRQAVENAVSEARQEVNQRRKAAFEQATAVLRTHVEELGEINLQENDLYGGPGLPDWAKLLVESR
jgi:hypothetical protein